MKSLKTLLVPLAALLIVMASRPAEAKSHLSDILNKGSRWSLNVDGEAGVLELLGGHGHQTPDGGWEMEMDVTWQGNRGKLIASADGQNREQKVMLRLRNRGGIPVYCDGYVAQYAGNLMAGTSRYRAIPGDIKGAWYAMKLR